MLTRFFGQSKPINFLFVAIYMMVFYIVANRLVFFGGSSFITILKEVALLLLYVVGMVILNFIAKKNDLNKVHTYKIILYACFTVLFINLLQNNSVISANIFVILALRRIISLRTNKDIKKKIFDAAFWICIASLFQFWTILFLIIVYFGILFHSNRSWKNFAIPITSVSCVAILATTYMLLTQDRFFLFSDWFQFSNFDFTKLNTITILLPISVVLAMVVWVSGSYLKAIQNASISQKPSMYLILMTLFVSMAIAIFSPFKNGSELLFMFAPLSVMTAKYFEREKEFWFKEVLLWLLILMPILIPIIF
ncbi:DUF6427 family protein [Croceibacter atlanticus]|uniref:DUF6427 family protein n=1 Tax=Croceibacter atlanticus TaxID=313588 RepID=UPI002E10006E|nr:DUF6427 family protein [Croceibacter atlanticus]